MIARKYNQSAFSTMDYLRDCPQLPEDVLAQTYDNYPGPRDEERIQREIAAVCVELRRRSLMHNNRAGQFSAAHDDEDDADD